MCQNWKVKLIFGGAYRLPGTGIVECLEIIDVGCNLKQFNGLTRLTLTPDILQPIYVTVSDHQKIKVNEKHYRDVRMSGLKKINEDIISQLFSGSVNAKVPCP